MVTKAPKTPTGAAIAKDISKARGKGALRLLGDADESVRVISTGSPTIDKSLGVGGLPRGRLVEVFGANSTGKTTLALCTMAQAHKADPKALCAYIDVEHSLHKPYAWDAGVDKKRLLYSEPENGEQALDIVLDLTAQDNVAVVVVDSTAAIVTEAEIEGDLGDKHVAPQARLMSQALKVLCGAKQNPNQLVIFISQERALIKRGNGPSKHSTGGSALKFYASIRLSCWRTNDLKIGEHIIGHRFHTQVIKSKLAPPMLKSTSDLIYGKGFSRAAAILEAATEVGIVEKAGNYFKFKGENIGQGRLRVIDTLDDNPDLLAAIEAALQGGRDVQQYRR